MERFTHPDHPLPADISEVLQHYESWSAATSEQQDAMFRTTHIALEQRQLKSDLYTQLFSSMGVDVERLKSAESASSKGVIERIKEAEMRIIQPPADLLPFLGNEFSVLPPRPPVADTTDFWWSDTTCVYTSPFSLTRQADGLHFKGKKTYDDGDLLFLQFGSKARFELDYRRIPQLTRASYRSAPNIELRGRLLGWTESEGIFSGDNWSKCWMTARQTLIQNQFGQGGSVPVILADTSSTRTIFDLEDYGRSVPYGFNGFFSMPAIDFISFYPGASIWAELEIRFDIQLEGNCLFWIWPDDLVLCWQQWPLTQV